MNICFVPSLQHLACTKVIISLFNKALKNVFALYLKCGYEFCGLRTMEYKRIRRQVTRNIKKLINSTTLQEKLETFFPPLFYEFELWLINCNRKLIISDETLFVVADSIPFCWLTDGTVDGEKLMKSLVKNSKIHRINRFALACTYCLYEDILNLWELLSKKEKEYIQKNNCRNYVVKEWVIWLKSSDKNWRSCVAWIIGTTLWKDNMYVMKRTLLSLIPPEGSNFFMKVLISGGVSCDILRFVLSLMTKEEQELIFKESPAEVFKCIASWPLRECFFDVVDNLWPYLTFDAFCSILDWLLMQIQNQWDPEDFLEILKYLWSKSTPDFQNAAKAGFRFSEPLQLVLESDFKIAFLDSKCFKCFRVRHVISSLDKYIVVTESVHTFLGSSLTSA